MSWDYLSLPSSSRYSRSPPFSVCKKNVTRTNSHDFVISFQAATLRISVVIHVVGFQDIFGRHCLPTMRACLSPVRGPGRRNTDDGRDKEQQRSAKALPVVIRVKCWRTHRTRAPQWRRKGKPLTKSKLECGRAFPTEARSQEKGRHASKGLFPSAIERPHKCSQSLRNTVSLCTDTGDVVSKHRPHVPHLQSKGWSCQ